MSIGSVTLFTCHKNSQFYPYLLNITFHLQEIKFRKLFLFGGCKTWPKKCKSNKKVAKQHPYALFTCILEISFIFGLLHTIEYYLLVSISVAMVTTDDFQKKLNYNVKEICQNHENICGDRTHQKLRGYILTRKKWISNSHAMERSQLWSKIVTK